MITNALFYNKIRISLVFFLLRMATNCLFWNLTLFYFWRNITKKSFVLMIIDQHCIMAADFCDTSLFENETPILIILKRFFMAFPWQKLAYKWINVIKLSLPPSSSSSAYFTVDFFFQEISWIHFNSSNFIY